MAETAALLQNSSAQRADPDTCPDTNFLFWRGKPSKAHLGKPHLVHPGELIHPSCTDAEQAAALPQHYPALLPGCGLFTPALPPVSAPDLFCIARCSSHMHPDPAGL